VVKKNPSARRKKRGKKLNRVHALAVLIGTSQFMGCASIVNGQNQSISVETRTEIGALSAASCKLSNNKGTWFVTTPGSATVQRSFEDLSVRCEKEPHEPGLLSVKSGTKPMAFGNIIFGGIIGAGVDMSTGAAYDYPTLITVTMGKSGTFPEQKSPPPNADATPSDPPKQ
jgi:hypothetical protein